MTTYRPEDSTTAGVYALTAGGGRAIVDALGRLWKPWLHPRDRFGRFIQTGSRIRAALKSGTATRDIAGLVERMDRNGDIWVRVDNVLSPGAKQAGFNPGEVVRVPRKDIEVLDAKARVKLGTVSRIRKLPLNALKNASGKLRTSRRQDASGNNIAPDDRILQAADKIDEALNIYNRDVAPNIGGRGVDKATLEENAVRVSDLFEEAASLIDQANGEGRSSSDDRMQTGDDAYGEMLNNVFSTILTAQGQLEGAQKARLDDGGQGAMQRAGLAQGRGRGDVLPGEVPNLPNAEDQIVYKDTEGNVIANPAEEAAKANVGVSPEGGPLLTEEEQALDFAANGGLDPRLPVRGVNAVAAAGRRWKKNLAARTAEDKNGDEIAAGYPVVVDPGTGRGGGTPRPGFVGVVQRVNLDKSGRVTSIEVANYTVDGTAALRGEEEATVDTYRVSPGSVERLLPEGAQNFAFLQGLAGIDGEYGIQAKQLAERMKAAGGQRRYAGEAAGRLAKINDLNPQALRITRDADGRLVGTGDWVFFPEDNAYAEILNITNNGQTLVVKFGDAEKSVRRGRTKAKFATGPNNAVLRRLDADQAEGRGRYEPTRAEAAAAARRLGLTNGANALESGVAADQLQDPFLSDEGFANLGAIVAQVRGAANDKARRNLEITDDERQTLQDGYIIGAAFAGAIREDGAAPRPILSAPKPVMWDGTPRPAGVSGEPKPDPLPNEPNPLYIPGSKWSPGMPSATSQPGPQLSPGGDWLWQPGFQSIGGGQNPGYWVPNPAKISESIPEDKRPEGLSTPEGSVVIANPASKGSVIVTTPDGITTEYVMDEATGSFVDTGNLPKAELPATQSADSFQGEAWDAKNRIANIDRVSETIQRMVDKWDARGIGYAAGQKKLDELAAEKKALLDEFGGQIAEIDALVEARQKELAKADIPGTPEGDEFRLYNPARDYFDAQGNPVPGFMEVRKNGDGLANEYYTPDNKYKVTQNRRGELLLWDNSDPANPRLSDALGTYKTWDEVVAELGPDYSSSESLTPEEISSSREESTLSSLSDQLGTDVSGMTAEEIVQSPEYSALEDAATQGDEAAIEKIISTDAQLSELNIINSDPAPQPEETNVAKLDPPVSVDLTDEEKDFIRKWEGSDYDEILSGDPVDNADQFLDLIDIVDDLRKRGEASDEEVVYNDDREAGTLQENIDLINNIENKLDAALAGEETPPTEEAPTPSGSNIPNGKGIVPDGLPAMPSGTSLQDVNYSYTYYKDEDGNWAVDRNPGSSPVIAVKSDFGAPRLVVLVDINGVKVPFYISTGEGGKEDVEVGKWYPFFGIGDGGWFNKTSGSDINDYYGNQELRDVAEWLDANIGDIRAADNIPQVGQVTADDVVDAINQDLNPAASSKDSDNARKNIADTLAKIEAARGQLDEVPTPEPTPSPELDRRAEIQNRLDTIKRELKRANDAYNNAAAYDPETEDQPTRKEVEARQAAAEQAIADLNKESNNLRDELAGLPEAPEAPEDVTPNEVPTEAPATEDAGAPAEEKVVDKAEGPQRAPAASTPERDPIEPGSTTVAENIANGIERWVNEASARGDITQKTATDAIDVVFALEEAINNKNEADFYAAVGRLARINGIPEGFRRFVGADVANIRDNLGGIFGEAPENSLKSKSLGGKYDPISSPEIVNAPEFQQDMNIIDKYLDDFGGLYELYDAYAALTNKYWNADKAEAGYKDGVKTIKAAYKRLASVLNDPEATEEDKTTAIDRMYQAMIANLRGQDPAVVRRRADLQTRLNQLQNGYDLSEVSSSIAGEDVVDSLQDVEWFNVVGGLDAGDFNIVDADGEPVEVDYAVEYPETRLILGQGDVTQEEFDDFWENVASAYFADGEENYPAIFVTVDENGDTIISVGKWTDNPNEAANIADSNGDFYYDAENGVWVDPNSPEPSLDGEPAEAPSVTPSQIEKFVNDLTDPDNGGSSVDLTTGQDSFDEGYIVSLEGFEQRIPGAEFAANPQKYLDEYVALNSEKLSEEGKILGAWFAPNVGGFPPYLFPDGQVVLDVSEVIADKAEAIQAGIDRNQDAIYDAANKTEIETKPKFAGPPPAGLVKMRQDNEEARKVVPAEPEPEAPQPEVTSPEAAKKVVPAKKAPKFKVTTVQLSAVMDALSNRGGIRGERAQGVIKMLKGEEAPTDETISDAYEIASIAVSDLEDIITEKPDWADVPEAKRKLKAVEKVVAMLENIDLSAQEDASPEPSLTEPSSVPDTSLPEPSLEESFPDVRVESVRDIDPDLLANNANLVEIVDAIRTAIQSPAVGEYYETTETETEDENGKVFIITTPGGKRRWEISKATDGSVKFTFTDGQGYVTDYQGLPTDPVYRAAAAASAMWDEEDLRTLKPVNDRSTEPGVSPDTSLPEPSYDPSFPFGRPDEKQAKDVNLSFIEDAIRETIERPIGGGYFETDATITEDSNGEVVLITEVGGKRRWEISKANDGSIKYDFNDGEGYTSSYQGSPTDTVQVAANAAAAEWAASDAARAQSTPQESAAEPTDSGEVSIPKAPRVSYLYESDPGTVEEKLTKAIEDGSSVVFMYDGAERVVTPVRIETNDNTGNKLLSGVEDLKDGKPTGSPKKYNLEKIEQNRGPDGGGGGGTTPPEPGPETPSDGETGDSTPQDKELTGKFSELDKYAQLGQDYIKPVADLVNAAKRAEANGDTDRAKDLLNRAETELAGWQGVLNNKDREGNGKNNSTEAPAGGDSGPVQAPGGGSSRSGGTSGEGGPGETGERNPAELGYTPVSFREVNTPGATRELVDGVIFTVNDYGRVALTGNTYPNRADIKSQQFVWDRAAKSWVFSGDSPAQALLALSNLQELISQKDNTDRKESAAPETDVRAQVIELDWGSIDGAFRPENLKAAQSIEEIPEQDDPWGMPSPPEPGSPEDRSSDMYRAFKDYVDGLLGEPSYTRDYEIFSPGDGLLIIAVKKTASQANISWDREAQGYKVEFTKDDIAKEQIFADIDEAGLYAIDSLEAARKNNNDVSSPETSENSSQRLAVNNESPESLGLPETPDYDRLGAQDAATILLQQFPDIARPEGIKKLFPGRKRIYEGNGITIRKIAKRGGAGNVAGGINADLSFIVEIPRTTSDGKKEVRKFFLKYDYQQNALAELITPRLIKAAGLRTPEVSPLTSAIYDESYEVGWFGGDQFGFIQTWGEGYEGEQVFGNLNTDARARGRLAGAQELQSEVEKAFSNQQTKDNLAKEFARMLVANILGLRRDTHEENWSVSRDASGSLRIIPIDNGLAGPASDRLNAESYIGTYSATRPGVFLDAYLKEYPEMEDEIASEIQDWFTNLQKWLESDGRNQFGSGGISGKDLGKRMQTYQRILREYQDMTPEEFWSRIRSQITYAGQGRTTDLAAFLRNIYERPSDGWYGELS